LLLPSYESAGDTSGAVVSLDPVRRLTPG